MHVSNLVSISRVGSLLGSGAGGEGRNGGGSGDRRGIHNSIAVLENDEPPSILNIKGTQTIAAYYQRLEEFEVTNQHLKNPDVTWLFPLPALSLPSHKSCTLSLNRPGHGASFPLLRVNLVDTVVTPPTFVVTSEK
ncbi:hypothetical protein PIB30_016759 [Stylosanthes scabra]|uniref:Uncharacterized protein n=1 Tax=Stylosanthes scabra TaxID=79078 RepID=A0ABU6Q7H5_9FABA|nr:hypothetical protein [Stylosanthes scabra]